MGLTGNRLRLLSLMRLSSLVAFIFILALHTSSSTANRIHNKIPFSSNANKELILNPSVPSNEGVEINQFAGVEQIPNLDSADTTRENSVYGRLDNMILNTEVNHFEDFQIVNLIITSDIEGNLNALNRKTGELIWSLVGGQPLVNIQSENEKISGNSRAFTTPIPESTNTYKKSQRHEGTSSDNSYTRNNSSNRSYKNYINEITWIVEPYGDGTVYHFTGNEGLAKLPISIKQFIMNSPFSIDDQFVYTGSRVSGIVKINARTGAIVESFGLDKFGTCSVDDSLHLGNSESDMDYTCQEEIEDLGYDEESIFDEESEYFGSHGYNSKENEIGPFITLGKTIYDLTIHSKNHTSWNITYVQWGPNNLHSNLIQDNFESKDDTYIQPFHDSSLLALDVHKKSIKWVSNLPYVTVNIFDVFLNSYNDKDEYLILPHPIDQTSQYPSENHDATYIDKTKEGSWYALSEDHYPSLVKSAPLAKYITNERWRLPSIFANDDLMGISMSGVHDHSLNDRTSDNSHMDSSNNHLAIYASSTAMNIPAKYSRYNHGIETRDGPEQKRFDNVHDSDDNNNKTPTTTFNSSTSTMSALVYRAIENVLVALICLFFFYVLSKLGLMKSLIRWGNQSIETELPKVVTIEQYDTEQHQYERKVGENQLAQSDTIQAKTKVNVEDIDSRKLIVTGNITNETEDNEEIVKRKRKRGSRAGKKNKKKDINASGITSTIITSANDTNTTSNSDSTPSNSIANEVPNAIFAESLANEPCITQISNNLSITDEVLGFGSHGTIVFKGYFENRPVAVKRMLLDFYDVASHEISLLQESDDHSNVIRYFCSQENNKFLYIALELCSASLEDVIEMKKPELNDVCFDKNQILYQIANGVSHLHSLKIVHRDIKPQNILVVLSKKKKDDTFLVRFLISDFGLCKKLDNDQSSFKGTTANAAGTSGWRAPELLLDTSPAYLDQNKENRVRLTRSVDVFSAGCVFFYILTGGYHPFGDRYIREGNIIKGEYDLSKLNTLPDAYLIKDLISLMIQKNPSKRPDISEVMKHPYFWSIEKKLDFLLKVSDRFEIERRDPPSPLLLQLESISAEVLGKKGWFDKFDQRFIDNLGKYRKYNTHKLMDLLRAVRNKYHHYQDLPKDLAEEMGPLPDGFYWYFATRFPRLLLIVHRHLSKILSDDELLSSFF